MASALANWLWQGCAIACAAAMVLRASRRMSATTRYQLWWITMAIVLVLPALKLQLPAAGSSLPASSVSYSASAIPQRAVEQAGDVAKAQLRPSPAAGVVGRAPRRRLGGVGDRLARADDGRARDAAREPNDPHGRFPSGAKAGSQTWLSLRARGRPARLTISDDVRAAAVLGLTSPSIAVAPVALARAERRRARSDHRARVGARATAGTTSRGSRSE